MCVKDESSEVGYVYTALGEAVLCRLHFLSISKPQRFGIFLDHISIPNYVVYFLAVLPFPKLLSVCKWVVWLVLTAGMDPGAHRSVFDGAPPPAVSRFLSY